MSRKRIQLLQLKEGSCSMSEEVDEKGEQEKLESATALRRRPPSSNSGSGSPWH